MIYNALHKFRVFHVIGRNLASDRFILFRWGYKATQKISFKRRVKRNGTALTIPVKKGVGLMNLISNYEAWMDEVLAQILSHRKGAFVDVGANIGQTLLKVLSVDKGLDYYAIEPNEVCAEYLKELAISNNYTKLKVFTYALSDSKGEAELLLRFRDDILATTSPSFRKYTKYTSALTVPQTTGDTLFQPLNIDSLSTLKIDVEGGEYGVLQGFTQTIQQHQPYLLLEILPLHSKDPDVAKFRMDNASAIISLLGEWGYSLYNIRQKSQVKTVGDISPSLESSNYIGMPDGESIVEWS